MRNVKIVADSSCDLFTLQHVPFATAPMKIVAGETEFIDDERLDTESMVRFLDTYKGKSKSSCPNQNDWIEAFGDADEIFCVTITSGLSGSYNSACLAKQIYEEEHPGRRVFILDSLSAGPEITLVIERLKALVTSETAFDEVVSDIRTYLSHTGLVFMLKSLKTFANNGRVSPLVAKLVGIAGICIVGKASDKGTLEPMHKCRGEARALETLITSLQAEGCAFRKISIGHCENEAAARQLKEMIEAKYENATVEIHPFRGLCSFYAERGGVLIGFEKE